MTHRIFSLDDTYAVADCEFSQERVQRAVARRAPAKPRRTR
jgi:hypothetical protein